MNILLITKNYPPAICGVGDHSAQLKVEWEKIGHKVWVFSTTKGTGDHSVISSVENEFSTAVCSQIQSVIKEHNIDHLFWQYVPYSFQQKGLPAWLPAVMRKLKATGVRQSVFFHEVSLRISGDGIRQSMAAVLQRKIANRMAVIADQSFTSIMLYRNYLKKLKSTVVPVGSNLTLPDSVTDLKEYHVVCFGNRADDALLQALLNLRHSLPISLTLCGSVAEHKKIQFERWSTQHQADGWFEITGDLPAADLANCIAAASIFVQPQVTDKMGRGGISAKNGTIMAAMSLGKAIMTCKGDMTDANIFRENENILFVPYGDSKAYEKAIRWLLDDPELAKRLGRNAAQTYQEHASWPQIAARLLAGMHERSSKTPG